MHLGTQAMEDGAGYARVFKGWPDEQVHEVVWLKGLCVHQSNERP